MASPKEPRYDVLSRTRNAPGSWSCSSWMAVGHSGAQPGAGGSPPQAQGCPRRPSSPRSLLMVGLNQNLEVSITNFKVGCSARRGPAGG